MDAVFAVPEPRNEPVLTYAPGSAERDSLGRRLGELAGEQLELTLTIGGEQRMAGGDRYDVVQPHRHADVLGHPQRDQRGRGRRGRGREAGRPVLAGAAVRRAGRGASCAPPTCWPGRGGTR